MSTLDVLLVFTSGGNYLHIPVHMIPDLKWKDMPKHVSNIIEVPAEENIVSSIPAYQFESTKNIITVTKEGMVKRSPIKDFKLQRYSKASSCMKLKGEDKLLSAFVEDDNTIMMISDSGYLLTFKTEDIPVMGVKASGVKGMMLKDDSIVSSTTFDYTKHEFLTLITEKGTAKRVRLNEFEISNRTRRGIQAIREVKSNPYKVLKAFIIDNKNHIGIKNGEITELKVTELPIADRYSTGSQVSKHNLVDAFVVSQLESAEENQDSLEIEEPQIVEVIEPKVPRKEKISLSEIDDRLMTIDDFLK